MRRVETLAELIIPETDTPGAAAARVHDFVDMMLSDFFSEGERGRFLQQLEGLDAVSASVVGVPFDRASAEEQAVVMRALDEEAFPDPEREPERAAQMARQIASGEPPFMRTMKELTVAGYYTSEIGQTVELHIPPLGSFEADLPLEDVGRSWA